MKKILCSVDFSEVSTNAVRYAHALAKFLKAELVLFHAMYVHDHVHGISMGSLEMELAEEINQKMKRLIQQDLQENVKYEIVKGYPLEKNITSFAKDNNYDLIVMGTSGASGIKRVLGSFTLDVVEKSLLPVLVIPPNAKYKDFQRIVYATDLLQEPSEISLLTDFSKKFGCTIDVLHIELDTDTTRDKKKSQIKMALHEKYKSQGLKFETHSSDDVCEGLDYYTKTHDADLLVMFKRELNFFQRIVDSSITKEICFHSNLPLLVFKRP